MLCLPGFHRLHGDLRRPLPGEVELPGGDAAEGQAFAALFPRQVQAGAVAGGQLPLVFFRQRPLDDGPHGVEHIPAGQVVGFGDFRLARGLWAALLCQEGRALQPEPHPGEGVDGVVDAAVAGDVAPGHAAVGGVDDGVHLQGGDVPLPEVEARLRRAQIPQLSDAPLFEPFPQIRVLHPQEFPADGSRRAEIHQAA